MANSFDPKGALIGGGILVLVLLIAAALIFPLPGGPVTIRLDLPPAKAPAR